MLDTEGPENRYQEQRENPAAIRTYTISQFSDMVGLPPSKIRFYDKYGVFKCQRNENGYRYFTARDAFRANAFRILRGYGFSVEMSVDLLNRNQDSPEFLASLHQHLTDIDTRIEQLNQQKERLLTTIKQLDGNIQHEFKIVDQEDILYVSASSSMDFSVSRKNTLMLEVFANLIPITSFARIISREKLRGSEDNIIPDYVNSIPKSQALCLGSYNRRDVKTLSLGRCLYYQRKMSRIESLKRSSFSELFAYMKENNFELRGDMIIFPSFLNLDGKGRDIESLYIPIKKH